MSGFFHLTLCWWDPFILLHIKRSYLFSFLFLFQCVSLASIWIYLSSWLVELAMQPSAVSHIVGVKLTWCRDRRKFTQFGTSPLIDRCSLRSILWGKLSLLYFSCFDMIKYLASFNWFNIICITSCKSHENEWVMLLTFDDWKEYYLGTFLRIF